MAVPEWSHEGGAKAQQQHADPDVAPYNRLGRTAIPLPPN